MKVCHFVSSPLSGGAARGALWLHNSLRDKSIDSHILTNSYKHLPGLSSSTTLNNKRKIAYSLLQKTFFKFLPYIYLRKSNYIFSTGAEGLNLLEHPLVVNSDIIHLHWINGLFPWHLISRFKKPVVWTFRDMWPFTGGCHYSMDCTKYINTCGKCPQLESPFTYDLSKLIISYKMKFKPSNQLSIVCISDWLAGCVRKSHIFSSSSIATIPNNVDAKLFQPIDKYSARSSFNLPHDKKIILVGAQSVFDFYKGFDLFLQSLDYLSIKHSKIQLLFFGNLNTNALSNIPFTYKSLGFLSDHSLLCRAYSSADVFVAPSRMDAFGKTIVESMLCGTPAVCFDATGPAGIIKHKITGYKALAFDPYDLSSGINHILSLSSPLYKRMSDDARKYAIENFSSDIISSRYIDLYSSLLSK